MARRDDTGDLVNVGVAADVGVNLKRAGSRRDLANVHVGAGVNAELFKRADSGPDDAADVDVNTNVGVGVNLKRTAGRRDLANVHVGAGVSAALFKRADSNPDDALDLDVNALVGVAANLKRASDFDEDCGCTDSEPGPTSTATDSDSAPTPTVTVTETEPAPTSTVTVTDTEPASTVTSAPTASSAPDSAPTATSSSAPPAQSCDASSDDISVCATAGAGVNVQGLLDQTVSAVENLVDGLTGGSGAQASPAAARSVDAEVAVGAHVDARTGAAATGEQADVAGVVHGLIGTLQNLLAQL